MLTEAERRAILDQLIDTTADALSEAVRAFREGDDEGTATWLPFMLGQTIADDAMQRLQADAVRRHRATQP